MNNETDNNSGCLFFLVIIGFWILFNTVVFVENTFGVAGTISILLLIMYLFRHTFSKMFRFLIKWGLKIVPSLVLAFPTSFFLMWANDSMGLGRGMASVIFMIGSYLVISFTFYVLAVKPILDRYLR